jgi:hypothetical protein
MAKSQTLFGCLFGNDRLDLVSDEEVSNNRLIGTDCSFELGCLLAIDFEVCLKVVTLSVLLDRVSECSLAPNFSSRQFAAYTGHKRADFIYGFGALLFASIATKNPN